MSISSDFLLSIKFTMSHKRSVWKLADRQPSILVHPLEQFDSTITPAVLTNCLVKLFTTSYIVAYLGENGRTASISRTVPPAT